jgi:hypothetical protein
MKTQNIKQKYMQPTLLIVQVDKLELFNDSLKLNSERGEYQESGNNADLVKGSGGGINVWSDDGE